MNILLIRPRPHRETIGLQHVMICEPLELEYLAGNIKRPDAQVEIIDMIIEREPLEYFIQKYQPDVVGMGGYITHVNVIKAYAATIKRLRPECKVVVGGVHAEVVPQDFVSKEIDFIIETNGIKTFNALLNDLENKDLEGTYREGKKSGQETSFQYKFPARDKVNKYRDKYYYMFHNPCALIKTSYGCPYNCSFCFCKEITRGKYFTREISSVIAELKEIPEKEIYIVDDDFLFSQERILEFCRELKKNNIEKNFLVYGRADFIANNEEVIKVFQAHGLQAVIVGLESCREEDLNKYNKKTSLRENEKAIAILKKYQVEIYGTLILPMDFSKKDFKNLHNWLKSQGLIFVNLQPLTPLEGTAIYQSYTQDFIIKKEEFEKWDLAHLVLKPSAMSIRQYYWEIVKLYYKVTMQPGNVLKIIKKYGLQDVLKLSWGSSMVTIQYLKKMIRGA